jgi:hypothetical protein
MAQLEIDWNREVQEIFPGAHIRVLEEPMKDVLAILAAKHTPEVVVRVLTSKPSETGGKHSFPFIRPDRAAANLDEHRELAVEGLGNRGFTEKIKLRAPVIADLFEETHYFDGFSYPNRFGEDVAWFARPGEDCLRQLEAIKAQTERLREFLNHLE